MKKKQTDIFTLLEITFTFIQVWSRPLTFDDLSCSTFYQLYLNLHSFFKHNQITIILHHFKRYLISWLNGYVYDLVNSIDEWYAVTILFIIRDDLWGFNWMIIHPVLFLICCFVELYLIYYIIIELLWLYLMMILAMNQMECSVIDIYLHLLWMWEER